MEQNSATVLVIDEDASVRSALADLVRAAGWHPDIFASAEEFLASPRHAAPCCLVLDVKLPGLSGLDLQRRLVDRNDMPMVFVSGATDVPTTVQAMKAGAVEFLTKPFRNEAMMNAIRDALARSWTAFRDDIAKRLLRNRYTMLTRRERQVMGLVVSGLLNKQIGGELGISEITVKAHRGQMMRKMQAGSVPDLVMMAASLTMVRTRREV